MLPAGRLRLVDEPDCDRIGTGLKTIGIVVGRFCCKRAATCRRGEHGDLATHQIGRQCGQPIDLTFRPAVFDGNIVTLDIAACFQALAKGGTNGSQQAPADLGVEIADHRHCRLLRTCRKRPRCRAANAA